MAPAPALGTLAQPANFSSASAAAGHAASIVRAHSACNLTMVERLLGLDQAAGGAVRTHLIRQGLVSGAKTAGGMVKTTQPWLKQALKARRQRLAEERRLPPEAAPSPGDTLVNESVSTGSNLAEPNLAKPTEDEFMNAKPTVSSTTEMDPLEMNPPQDENGEPEQKDNDNG